LFITTFSKVCGGYVLAKERRKITLGEIVRVIGTNEDEGSPYQVSQSDLGRKVVVPIWKTAEDKMLTYLDTITLDTMCNKAHQNEIKRPFNKVTDFTI
jgi:Rrf2 family transcriptional regulator, iron-sulfur cluster assembly transcription factor